jgi:hypothetical protein
LQAEIAQTKKKAAKFKAPPATRRGQGHAGGYVEAATVFRTHNTVNDMLTVFNAIPYPSSPRRRLCLSEIKLAHTDDEVRQEMA